MGTGLAHERITRRGLQTLLAVLALSLTSAFWALNSVIGRAVHQDISPVALSFWRWMAPVLILAPCVWGELKREWPVIRRHWKQLVLLGLIGTSLHNVATYWALHYTEAINIQLLNSTIPLGVMLFAWIALGARPHRREVAGFAISLFGVLVIVCQGTLERLATFDLNKGDVVALLAMLVWGANTTLIKTRPPTLSIWLFTFVTAAVGVVALVPLYAWELARVSSSLRYTPFIWGGILYMGIFGSLVATAFLSFGIDRLGPARAALHPSGAGVRRVVRRTVAR
jgi:drug/metabolite transporter (DMT)-like permease